MYTEKYFEFSISFLYKCETFFCLGGETTNFIEDLGAQIKRIVPIGSIVLKINICQIIRVKNIPKLKI